MQSLHGAVLHGKMLLHLEYVRKRSLLQALFDLQRQQGFILTPCERLRFEKRCAAVTAAPHSRPLTNWRVAFVLCCANNNIIAI